MVLDKDIHQQNTTERPEINPYICRRLISDKCAKNKSWRKHSLFNSKICVKRYYQENEKKKKTTKQWKETFANHTPDKVLISRMFIEHLHLSNEETVQFKNGQRI